MQQVHGPATALAIDVEDEPVRAAVDAACAETGRRRRDDEDQPRRRQPETDDAARMDEHGATEDEASTEALGQRAAAERARSDGQGQDQVDDAETRVGLLERRLDRTDQGRDEQPGPADREQGQASDKPSCQTGARGHGLRRLGSPLRSGWRLTGSARDRGCIPVGTEAAATDAGQDGGRYWIRTSDLTDVNRAL